MLDDTKRRIAYRVNPDGSKTEVDISTDADGDSLYYDEKDLVEYEGRHFVLNWNYLWLAYKRGWKDGINGRYFDVSRWGHPDHKKMYKDGYLDGEEELFWKTQS